MFSAAKNPAENAGVLPLVAPEGRKAACPKGRTVIIHQMPEPGLDRAVPGASPHNSIRTTTRCPSSGRSAGCPPEGSQPCSRKKTSGRAWVALPPAPAACSCDTEAPQDLAQHRQGLPEPHLRSSRRWKSSPSAVTVRPSTAVIVVRSPVRTFSISIPIQSSRLIRGALPSRHRRSPQGCPRCLRMACDAVSPGWSRSCHLCRFASR